MQILTIKNYVQDMKLCMPQGNATVNQNEIL